MLAPLHSGPSNIAFPNGIGHIRSCKTSPATVALSAGDLCGFKFRLIRRLDHIHATLQSSFLRVSGHAVGVKVLDGGQVFTQAHIQARLT